jgi:hypothetical protein
VSVRMRSRVRRSRGRGGVREHARVPRHGLGEVPRELRARGRRQRARERLQLPAAGTTPGPSRSPSPSPAPAPPAASESNAARSACTSGSAELLAVRP